MKKGVAHRIAYYTRKVAEKFSIHPAKKPPRSYTYRHERLMAYKKMMHEQIKARS
jgi:hypothetical protein